MIVGVEYCEGDEIRDDDPVCFQLYEEEKKWVVNMVLRNGEFVNKGSYSSVEQATHVVMMELEKLGKIVEMRK